MPRKAELVQVRAGKGGRLIEIDQDVLDVCKRLREVDPCLGVDYNEDSCLFRVSELCADGRKRTVCWVEELTADLPDYLQRLTKTDYVKEIERMDAQADRDRDHAFHERMGPIGERLAFALRKDFGVKSKAFVPRDI